MKRKGLDEETGLYYYGARYYNPRESVWLSVDPLAEKHPNASPYAYAANNPVLYIDPDGRDYIVSIDFDSGTVTISATVYATDSDISSAEKAAENWNNQSGNYNYTFKDGEGNKRSLKINYDIKVSKVGVKAGESKLGALNKALGKDRTGGGNVYNVVSDDKLGKNTNGTTAGNYIRVKDSKKDGDTSTHELGHALGLPHSDSGIMTPASSDPNRTSDIKKTDIEKMIKNPIKGRSYSDGRGKATLNTTGTKLRPSASRREQRRYKNGSVEKNR